MKIAVTAQGDTLDSPVEPRFGRCSHVLLLESKDMGVEVVSNPYAEESGGAGSRLAGLVAARGVDVVLTGSPGPNTLVALEVAGIRTVVGCSGTARQALEAFMTGEPGEGG